MPVERAIRENWSDNRFHLALNSWINKSHYQYARRVGKRMASVMLEQHGTRSEAIVAIQDEKARFMLQDYLVLSPELQELAKLHALVRLNDPKPMTRGGCVLHAQKAQYRVNS